MFYATNNSPNLSNVIDQTWQNCNPWPTSVILKDFDIFAICKNIDCNINF